MLQRQLFQLEKWQTLQNEFQHLENISINLQYLLTLQDGLVFPKLNALTYLSPKEINKTKHQPRTFPSHDVLEKACVQISSYVLSRPTSVDLNLSWGVVERELRNFAMDTEFFLKAANAFIIWCVAGESNMSRYDACLWLSTKLCVPYACLFNV